MIYFLILIYCLGLVARLIPRLSFDPHLLTFNADIWYRLCLAQYVSDFGRLPEFCLRYIAYGQVPFWYPPVSPVILSFLSRVSTLDLPTVCSRLVPFIEALTPLPFFFLVRRLYNRAAAVLATLILALTPSFIYWTGIADPQSLTLFLLPIYILMLLWRNELKDTSLRGRSEATDEAISLLGLLRRKIILRSPPRNDGKSIFYLKRLGWILGLAALLALNFLTHLTYFLALLILVLFALGMKIEGRLKSGGVWLDLILAILLSQVLTAWWWAPKNLYWWWVNVLVTSSSGSLAGALSQMTDYGLLAASLGIFSVVFFLIIFCFFPRLKKPYLAPIFLWLGLVFLETQAELIMKLIGRLDLTWSPLVKPLEGYRFYCFLAQPLSLLTAIVVTEYDVNYRAAGKKLWQYVFLGIICAGLLLDLGFIYRLPQRWERAGINQADYAAALWFREHSRKDARIIADYYRAQMFAGVCAGRALLGGLFPLRNVKLPYITRPAVVQDDIYTIYSTASASECARLMKKYGATHLYYSPELVSTGGFGSKFRQGHGVEMNKDKFRDQKYFEEVYREAEAVIIAVKDERLAPQEIRPQSEFIFEQ